MKKNKILLSIFLSFLAILSPIYSIKAFTPNEHETSSRNAISIRNGSTNIYSVNCTSGNFCYLNFSDVSSSTFSFNRLAVQYLNSSNMTFKTGSIYKINLYFSSFIYHNVMYADDVSSVTGVSYQNLTSWPSNDLVIKSWSLKEVEEIDYQTYMYNLEVIFQTTNSTVAGLSFNLNFKNTKTGQKDSGNGFIIYRWYDLETLNDYNDYTQDFNNVINNQNQNTQDVIDNQNQNTQDVINNQNQNTQDVIDNQNQNSEDIQNTINDNFQSCRDSKNLLDLSILEQGYWQPTSNPSLSGTNGAQYRSFNLFLKKGTYTINFNNNVNSVRAFTSYDYSSDTSLTNYYNAKTNTFTMLEDGIVYLSFRKYDNLAWNDSSDLVWLYSGTDTGDYEAYGKQVCVNKLDEQNNAINNINDSITDSTPPDTNSLSNASGWLPPGPVDSILNLPLTLLQSLNNAFSTNSCQPINVNLPYVNAPLTIPCMSTVWEGFGLLTFFTWVGRVLGGILLYKYLTNLYKWVDDTLTMRENNNFDDGSLG